MPQRNRADKRLRVRACVCVCVLLVFVEKQSRAQFESTLDG